MRGGSSEMREFIDAALDPIAHLVAAPVEARTKGVTDTVVNAIFSANMA